ncbi:ribonuclease P protein component [Candidatus Peregrinibacteria bacterium]|nr:ribonuclease P protein component [Candidatus Peregrinibacteria bacterium]
MLKRNKRIGIRDNIDELAKSGDAIKGRLLIVRTRQNALGYNRYGVNISKKLAKSAVVRNKLRRRIYEIIRLNEKSGKIGPKSLDIMIFARKALLDSNYTNMETDLL